MSWELEYDPKAVKAIKKLDRKVALRILTFLSERVSTLEDPRSIGEALRGSKLGNYWKYRVGNYRIIADIQDGKVVILVLDVGHRSAVYKPND